MSKVRSMPSNIDRNRESMNPLDMASSNPDGGGQDGFSSDLADHNWLIKIRLSEVISLCKRNELARRPRLPDFLWACDGCY